jgi:hypothetical protein
MALKFGILPSELEGFDSEGLPLWDDRAVDEEYFARYHQELLENGISAKAPTSFQVVVESGKKLRVKPGAIFIEGYFAYDSEPAYVELEQENPSASRIDRIVFRLDKPNRLMEIKVLRGKEGILNLEIPELIRTQDIYDMSLATVKVNRGQVEILPVDITDTRMEKSECGVVANYLGDVDFADFFAKYDNEFQQWFDSVKENLGTDPMGHLQNQVNELKEEKVAKEEFDSAINEVREQFSDLAVLDTVSDCFLPVDGGITAVLVGKALLITAIYEMQVNGTDGFKVLCNLPFGKATAYEMAIKVMITGGNIAHYYANGRRIQCSISKNIPKGTRIYTQFFIPIK